MKVIDILKKAGFKFSRKVWPTISVQEIKALGITPEMLRAEFGNACLEQTPIGNRPRIGLMLDTGGSSRPLCVREKTITKIGPCKLL